MSQFLFFVQDDDAPEVAHIGNFEVVAVDCAITSQKLSAFVDQRELKWKTLCHGGGWDFCSHFDRFFQEIDGLDDSGCTFPDLLGNLLSRCSAVVLTYGEVELSLDVFSEREKFLACVTKQYVDSPSELNACYFRR